MHDYVIVGAGSAGCVLAARLSEDPNARVCLIEAGGPDKSPLIHCPGGLAFLAKLGAHNWAFETVPQAGLMGRRGYQPRGKVLGGSSSVNAMVYMRGQHEDYDAWAAAGNAGWSWNDVLPWFRKAEHHEPGANEWHGQGGPLSVAALSSPHRFARFFVEAAVQAGYPRNADFNGATQEGVGLYEVTHKNGERCSAAKAYLVPARSRTNLEVVTGAHAERIVFEGRRAVGVDVRAGGATRRIAAAREVLVCAGALQSPQLLMLSGIGPGAHLQQLGIATLHDAPGVGSHLHDHPDVILVHDAPHLKDLFGLSARGLLTLGGAALEWRNHRRGLLTTNFAEAGGFIRSTPSETRPDLQLHFVIGKLVDHGRATVFGHGYSCHVCVLRPKSRGSVRLASPDPMAAPAIDPNFLAEQDDVDRLVRGVKLVRRILSQPALATHGSKELASSAAAQSDAEIERFVRAHADTIYHPVGSVRMGPQASDPLDAELRVRGVEALRVVDASVMPQVVSGNTNAPTIMIAEKAAALIKAAASGAPARGVAAVAAA